MKRGYYPLQAAGYRGNPFRALTREEWEEVAVLPEALARFEADAAHRQILGAAGRGKTSALRALAARMEETQIAFAYERIPEGERRFTADLRPLACFLLDEAQRLAPRERRRLLGTARRNAVRLFLASHEDLTPLFDAFHQPLHTLCLNDMNQAHFDAAMESRLRCFALPGAPRATLTEDARQWLWNAFGSDLRGAELFLYEVFQELSGPEAVDAAQLSTRRREDAERPQR